MSQKPIAQKLQIKHDHSVLLVNEPKDYRTKLGKLPNNVTLLTKPIKPADLIQIFLTSKKELDKLNELKSFPSPTGLL